MKNARLAADVTPQVLWDLFQEQIQKKFEGEDYVSLQEIVESIGKIGKDIAKVRFDYENSYYRKEDSWGNNKFGPGKIGELSAITCRAGGDWEYPISFIIYLDQDGKTFRGYIPSDGNPWNRDTKQAFGNDEEDDNTFLKKWIKKNAPDLIDNEDEEQTFSSDDADVMHDLEAYENDIKERIKVKK